MNHPLFCKCKLCNFRRETFARTAEMDRQAVELYERGMKTGDASLHNKAAELFKQAELCRRQVYALYNGDKFI